MDFDHRAPSLNGAYIAALTLFLALPLSACSEDESVRPPGGRGGADGGASSSGMVGGGTTADTGGTTSQSSDSGSVTGAQAGGSAGGASATGNGASASGGSGASGASGAGDDDGSGSGFGVTGGECGAVSEMAQNVFQPVDIIFGVDTSGSMAEEVAEVQRNLNAFSQQIIDAGVDVHVIMLASAQGAGGMAVGPLVDGPCIAPPLGSGSCPDDSNLPTYVHLDKQVTSWDVLDVFVDSYPEYREHLRENSLKTFVAISDDDANPMNSPAGALIGIIGGAAGGAGLPIPTLDSADKFVEAVANLEPGSPMWASWRYSAIFTFDGTCPSAAAGGAEGLVHRELVERTQGVAGDLCQQDFAPVFDELARSVVDIVSLTCDWPIPAPPDGESFDAAKTNVDLTLDGVTEALPNVPAGQPCDDRGGWHYDDDVNPSRVVACPASCQRIESVGRSAQVDLLFGCETIVVPIL